MWSVHLFYLETCADIFGDARTRPPSGWSPAFSLAPETVSRAVFVVISGTAVKARTWFLCWGTPPATIQVFKLARAPVLLMLLLSEPVDGAVDKSTPANS